MYHTHEKLYQNTIFSKINSLLWVLQADLDRSWLVNSNATKVKSVREASEFLAFLLISKSRITSHGRENDVYMYETIYLNLFCAKASTKIVSTNDNLRQ